MDQKKLTVNDLIKALQALKKQGYGNANVVLSTDDEWNKFRCLWNSQISSFDESELDEIDQVKEFDINNKFIVLG